MKYLPLFTILFVTLSSCHNQPDTVATSADSTISAKGNTFNVKQLAGVFYDTLPCADCPGIATQLYLKPDNTFIMERNYVGKNIMYLTGTWSLNDSTVRLNENNTPEYFKVKNHALLEMLDREGKEINMPDKPQLHRNNVPFKPTNPVPVEGIFSAVEDTMKIHICSMDHDYAATLSPDAMMVTARYKQVAKPGEPVFAKLAGHFELRPSLQDTTTRDFFVIEKFISFAPGKQCEK